MESFSRTTNESSRTPFKQRTTQTSEHTERNFIRPRPIETSVPIPTSTVVHKNRHHRNSGHGFDEFNNMTVEVQQPGYSRYDEYQSRHSINRSSRPSFDFSHSSSETRHELHDFGSAPMEVFYPAWNHQEYFPGTWHYPTLELPMPARETRQTSTTSHTIEPAPLTPSRPRERERQRRRITEAPHESRSAPRSPEIPMARPVSPNLEFARPNLEYA
ncbi:hypothetical protein FPQ18DRAFT_420372 [Pyronema domesticum]|uniref:Uncharacterized protein n=1 Tax=Pyronema omphalodes (strain CBS 100304) TaxID=1076935 RepID=U4LL99_PYROM|nr:hypothetical protein FPQ18DRAFT_420372 [Pyronema domesticum]CCX32713.1 Protein of unknown function [Pyronema omphalodes CBS 100304]